MRRYVMITGVVFALLALVHIARVALEGWRVATEPLFVVITVLAAALSLWAWRLLRRTNHP